jgi:hypothetical protein
MISNPLRLSHDRIDRCQMNSGKRYGQQIRRGTIGAILSLATAIFGGCDITQPSEEQWKDVNTFAWSTDTLRYHVWIKGTDSAITDTVILVGRDSLIGSTERIRILEKIGSDILGPLPIHTRLQKDTLIVTQGDGLPPFQLTGPIVVGGTWFAQIFERPGDAPVPTWNARIVNRHGRKIIGEKAYDDVLEVEYRPLRTEDVNDGLLWVRYFAKGVGPILTKKFADEVRDNVRNVLLVEEYTLLPE